MTNKKWKAAMLVTAAMLLAACGLTDPSSSLVAGFSIEEVDSLDNRVTFAATAPDTLWWKLDWRDLNTLFDYGTAVYDVAVPVVYGKGFRFWMDFTVWNRRDTVTVTFMSPEGEG